MPKTPPSEPVEERIQDIDLSHEMQGSFLEYAYSVIYSRALPDDPGREKPLEDRVAPAARRPAMQCYRAGDRRDERQGDEQ